MRYLILSDIHGNLEALDAVMADASEIGFDQVICLGDLVGYGASPHEVLDQVFALNPVAIIRGNHDKVCAGIEAATNFNDAARESAEWTRRVLTPSDTQRLADLPAGPLTVEAGLEICHGAPFDEDFYVFDDNDAARAMAAASAPLCLYGHTHVPAVYSRPDYPVTPSGRVDDELLLPSRGRAIVNVGSVGQPRDGDSRAAYGLLDTTAGAVRLRRVPYDIKGAQRRIRAADLPEWLADRLTRGK